jgi:predicted dehydrogenase
MPQQLRAVVVGTGFGARVHVPALRAAGFDVVGLVGTDPERTARRAARAGVEHPCTSLAEALALPGVEVITISAPPAAHAPLTHEALAAGRHVICEKPFALDATEADALLAAARRAGVAHALGHELRWFPERATILQALRAGAIGEPRFVSIVDFVALLTDPAIRMPAWYFDARAGGGWLGASGSHAIDMVRLWLGDFARVSASTTVVDERRGDADDSFVLQFRLASGVTGVIQQTGGAFASASQTVVTGTEGTLRVHGGQVQLVDGEGRRTLHPLADASTASATGERPTQLESMTSHETPAYTELCAAFARTIRGEDPQGHVPLPTFEDGAAAMRVMDAARASAAAGGAVVDVAAAPDASA